MSARRCHCLLLAVSIAVSVSATAGEVPLGFRVLGSSLPASAENITIPAGWVEQLPDTNVAAPPWRAEEARRGYVLFAKSYMDMIYPRTRPLRREITSLLGLSSPLGQYEPVTFSVHALKPMQKVRVTVSDLKGPGGHTIERSNIDVRSVRCWPRRVWKNPGVAEYTVRPWFLEKRPEVDIAADTTQRFWLTVYVPADSAPGPYQGTITVDAGELGRQQLALRLDVFPFALLESPARQGMYYWVWHHRHDPPETAYRDEYIYKEIMNMKAHGMNTVFMSVPPICKSVKDGDTVRFDLDPLVPVVQACREAGFDPVIYNIIIGKMFIDNMAGADFPTSVKAFVEGFRQRGWPEPVLSAGDEADANNSLGIVMSRLAQVRSVLPKAVTYETIVWPRNSEVFEPHIDIRAFSSYMCQDAVAPTRKAGRQLWMYSGSDEGGGKTARVYRGIWGAALGLDGMLDWTYFRLYKTDKLFDDLANTSSGPNHRGYVFPTPDGPLPTPAWEGIREGVEDERFIFTLKTRIQQARHSRNSNLQALADDADKHLATILTSVDTAPRADKSFPVSAAGGQLTVDFLNAFREQTAQYIEKLQR